MYSFATYKDQYKANLRLALPVVLTQLGQILTQVLSTDTGQRLAGKVKDAMQDG